MTPCPVLYGLRPAGLFHYGLGFAGFFLYGLRLADQGPRGVSTPKNGFGSPTRTWGTTYV